jgi:hypothetical protein
MSDVEFAGIIPNNVDVNWKTISYGYCNDPNGADVGTDLPEQVPPGTADCSSSTYLDTVSLKSYFTSNCKNKNECSFQIGSYVDRSDTTSVCVMNPAKVYMQYRCVESPTTI